MDGGRETTLSKWEGYIKAIISWGRPRTSWGKCQGEFEAIPQQNSLPASMEQKGQSVMCVVNLFMLPQIDPTSETKC